MARNKQVIWVKRETKYFYKRGWTQYRVICPIGQTHWCSILRCAHFLARSKDVVQRGACGHPSRRAEGGAHLTGERNCVHPGMTAPLSRQFPQCSEVLCRLYKSPLEPRSHSYPPTRIFLTIRGAREIRKTSHDEDDYFGRIDDGAGCDLRTGIGRHHRAECTASCPCSGEPDGNARLRCGGGDAGDSGAQCAPLSRRTESQRLRRCRRHELALERDDFSSNRHLALTVDLKHALRTAGAHFSGLGFISSMISSENRWPLFRIMLCRESSCHLRTRPRIPHAPIAAVNSEISTL
jgi:hypothetical protein